LIVADVGVHPWAARQAGLRGRHGHTTLRQDNSQPDHLQDHRLAAGVGPGDDHRAGVGAQVEVERHRFRRVLLEGVEGVDVVRQAQHRGDHQRVARTVKRQLPVGKNGPHGIGEVGETCLRLPRIELADTVLGPRQCIGGSAYVTGEVGEQALDLMLLGTIRLHQRVLLVERLQRLDVDGLPRRGGVVHHAGECAASPGAHRNDVTAAALRHQAVAQHAIELVVLHQMLERLHHARPEPALLAPQRRQLGRRRIAHLPVVVEHPLDLRHQRAEIGKAGAEIGQ